MNFSMTRYIFIHRWIKHKKIHIFVCFVSSVKTNINKARLLALVRDRLGFYSWLNDPPEIIWRECSIVGGTTSEGKLGAKSF